MNPEQIPQLGVSIEAPGGPALPSTGIGEVGGAGQAATKSEAPAPKRKVIVEDSKISGDGIKLTLETTDDADPRADFLLSAFTQTLQQQNNGEPNEQ